MNERIRKLAIKSGIDIRGHLSGVLTLDEKPGVNDLVKFAELIVKECAKVAGQEQVYNERHEIPVDIEHSVLEHFGVE